MEKLKYLVVEREVNDDRREVWMRVKGRAIDRVAKDEAFPPAVAGSKYVVEVYADRLSDGSQAIIRAILRDTLDVDRAPPLDRTSVRLFFWGREAVLDITAPHPSIW